MRDVDGFLFWLDDHGVFQAYGDYASGLSSALTFGLSEKLIDATGLGRYGDKCSTARSVGEIAGTALLLTSGVGKAPTVGRTVLGKFPDYLRRAEKIGARRFNIRTHIWNKMSPAEQWAANTRFLDRAIARGDEILLSNPVKSIGEATGSFAKELRYLADQGYRLAKDGARMIR